ncbi:MAG: hypothetical protein ACRDHE_17350, partial [Ktedonobacterales bacterium]
MSMTHLTQFSEGLAEVAEQLRAGVVQVRTAQGGIGSGVVWRVGTPDANGVVEASVITNAHVARAAQSRSFTLR